MGQGLWVGDSRVVAGGAGVSFVLYRVLHKLHTRACLCEAGRGRPQSAGARVAHRVVDEAHDQQREHDDAEVRVCGGGARGEPACIRHARGTQGDSPPTTPTSSVGCCSSSARFTGPSGLQSGASAILFVLWSSTSLPSSSCWAAPREVVPPPAEDLAGMMPYPSGQLLWGRSGRVMGPPSRDTWQAQVDCAGRRILF